MPLSTDRVPRRRGRIVWDETDTMGTAPAPSGTFPWMASLFVLFRHVTSHDAATVVIIAVVKL